MNEELTPREHAELRESVIAGVGRLRAARTRRSRIVAGAAAAAAVTIVVAVVWITASMPPAHTTAPVETRAPSPSAPASTPVPSPSAPAPSPTDGGVTRTVTAPTIVFDGSCDSVVDTASLVALWSGGGVTLLPYSGEPYTRTLGGMSCAWSYADGTFVNAHVYPLDVVRAEIRETYSEVSCGTSVTLGISCSEAIRGGSTWMLIELGGDQYQRGGESASPDENLMRARLDAARALFEDSLNRAGDGVPSTTTPESSPSPSCVELSSVLPLSELLNSEIVERDPPHDGGPGIDQQIAESAMVFQRCSWWVPDRSPFTTLSIDVYRGAAWDWDRISTVPTVAATRLVEIAIPGAVAAAAEQLNSDSSFSRIYATDGVNVVEVRSSVDVVAAATAAMAALR